MSLKIGEELPDFKLKDQNGNVFSINSVKGIKPVVIYFYPKNFTPGCTKEACSFRDNFEDFLAEGALVIGISSDSETSHNKFSAKYNLPFTLLADTKGKVRKLFGVRASFLGLLPGRETFVFNKDGKLTYKFQALNAQPHIDMALSELQKLK
tara:strand:- start:164165 stop:164620 length:456 start_codon:yes stop_codon:yes gene_type:complete